MSKTLDQLLPPATPPAMLPETKDNLDIVTALTEYKREADENRKSGLNPRDTKWQQNLDLYHNRYDFTTKADWQSKNTMPEVPSYVDRFAAALKSSLGVGQWYTVEDPYDDENNLGDAIQKMTDVWLSTCGRNQVGTPLDFMSVFEEQVKLGALMAMSGVVIWRDDVPGGRVAFETVDPRNVWLDHTYRNLYRIRSTEIDVADLIRMADKRSAKGDPLYNVTEVQSAVTDYLQQRRVEAEQLTGNGQNVASNRKPIILDEYIASVVNDQGKLIMDDEVAMVCNDKFLVRGPEKKPFMHGRDWLVYTPLVNVPLSPYGRSYMEDFGGIAKVFTELTNLLLDAAYMSSMNAYALVPAMLLDPTQATSGIHPNKVFLLEDGYNAAEFAQKLELGSLDAGAMQVWQNIKNELSEAAGMNEIGLGQLPDKSHIAATAVSGAQQSTSMILRSVAQTIETRFLDPALDLVWKTGLQHVSRNDRKMQAAVGDEMFAALLDRREELIKRPMTFQARGISALISRQQKLQQLLQITQVIAQNQNLTTAFMQRIDMNKFIDLLFHLSNVDLSKLEPTARERMIAEVTGQLRQAGQGGQPGQQAQQQMGDLATQMGVAQ